MAKCLHQWRRVRSGQSGIERTSLSVCMKCGKELESVVRNPNWRKKEERRREREDIERKWPTLRAFQIDKREA